MATATTMKQEDVLRKLVQGEEGREWADQRNKGWATRTTDSVCDWDGISCDEGDGTVTSIVLPETDLLATLPTELALLPNLATINLKQNMLWGTLPTELTSMPSLVTVNLQDNHIKSKVSAFRSKLLQRLDISDNGLMGHIVPDFGADNQALIFLDLQKNQLSGYLPYGLEDLPNLDTISISYNDLSGTLPEYLGSMTGLKFLYLNHNHLVGTLPSDLGGFQSNATNVTSTNLLQEIWLQNNALSGTIPASLAEASLTDLYLDGNKLTGTVPLAVCHQKLNADFFDGPQAERTDGFCDSVSCPAGTVSDEGTFPCRSCDSTIPQLYLGQKGECDDLTEVRIVDLLLGGLLTATITSCSDLDRAGCSACDFDGVTCNDDNKVISIVARGAGLKGALPDELGLLPFLSELDVADNDLTGYFPSGLRFAPLKSLHISGNKIRGIIPPLLCENANQINGGQAGGSCTSIACPVTTYSLNGTGFGECTPCSEKNGAPYLGSKFCGTLDLDNVTLPAPEQPRNVSILSGLFIAAAFITAIVGGIFIYYVNRERRKRLRNWDKGFAIEDDSASASLPHQEEVKMMVSNKFKHRGNNNSADKAGGTKWVTNHLKRTYCYVISLTETEDVKDPPGVKSRNVTEGEIDDYGWQERESILKHRDLEVAVETQKNATKLEVWEYPDPLERGLSYCGSSDDGEHDYLSGSDDGLMDDNDLSEWIKKQQSDPATREEWLDVPRIE